eukprot:5129775-Lingulodinium_polyedra.AAC.1
MANTLRRHGIHTAIALQPYGNNAATWEQHGNDTATHEHGNNMATPYNTAPTWQSQSTWQWRGNNMAIS